jgi:hypothetical protein
LEAKIFSTPASSKRRDSFSIERAKKNKENKQRFTFATRRMTASRAILISRRRRGLPLNLNLDDATFGKPKSSVIPFSARARAPLCVRARACKTKQERNARRQTRIPFFSSFIRFLWIRSVARSESFGCVVCKWCKCVPHFAPNISRDICNFFF